MESGFHWPNIMKTLPARIFLDTSTLQTIHQYDAAIFENLNLDEDARVLRIPGGGAEVIALRELFRIAERGPFEFAISRNSLAEVGAKQDSRFLAWAYDVQDHWEQCLFDSGRPQLAPEIERALNSNAFGYLSVQDRALVADAVAFNCDSFLTMELRLPKASTHLEKVLGLRVERPTGLWQAWKPYSALYW